MWLVEVSRSGSQFAPGLDELTVFGKLQDASGRTCGAGVAFRHEDIAVRRNENVIRLEKKVGITAPACLAKRHQKFSVLVELEYLMTSRGCWRSGCCGIPTSPTAARARAIRNPDIVLTVHKNSVRGNHQARAKALDQFSVCVEVQNWISHGTCAGVGAAAFG